MDTVFIRIYAINYLDLDYVNLKQRTTGTVRERGAGVKLDIQKGASRIHTSVSKHLNVR